MLANNSPTVDTCKVQQSLLQPVLQKTSLVDDTRNFGGISTPESQQNQYFEDALTEGDRHPRNVEIYKKLFPYRYAGIMATKLGEDNKPRWFERKYIADQDYERLGDKDFFLGVSFDKTTEYTLFDIDRGSTYHPENSQTEFKRFLEWLESIGCIAPLIVQSSFSEGLHVYFVFSKSIKTYNLACTLRDEAITPSGSQSEIAAGFKVKKGQLEIFPNPKNREARYMKHRLPLQEGSFILDRDLNPISNSIADFERHWKLAAESNDLALLKAAMKRSYCAFQGIKSGDRPYSLSPKQKKLKDDLEAYIAEGWTGHGQTEEILKRIARHTVMFANEGKGVANLEEGTHIALEIAMNAPGVSEWCRNHPDYIGSSEHPKEGQTLEVRIRGWMKCALRQYNPVMVRDIAKIQAIKATLPEKDLTPQERKQDALERQKKAVEEAIAQNLTFKNKTELMKWLVKQAKSSFQTLRKNWTILWEKVKSLIIPSTKQPEANQDKSFSLSPKLSLFVLKVSCNSLLCKDSSDFQRDDSTSSTSCNPSHSKGSKPIQDTCININVFCNSYGIQDQIFFPAQQQASEKEHSITQEGSASVSAGYQLSSTSIDLTHPETQNEDLPVVLGDLAEPVEQLTAPLKLPVQAIATDSELQEFSEAAKSMRELNSPALFRGLLARFRSLEALQEKAFSFGVFEIKAGFRQFKIRFTG